MSTLNSKLPEKVPVLPFLVARLLEVEAGLEGVRAARQRRGVVDGHERVGAGQREAAFEGDRRRIWIAPVNDAVGMIPSGLIDGVNWPSV